MRSLLPTTTATASIAIGSNSTTLGPFPVLGSVMAVSVENAGATALATLVLQVKATPSDLNYQTIASGTTWAATNNAALMIASSGSSIATLGSNSAGWAMVRVGAFTLAQLTATVGGTNTSAVNANVAFSDT